jgi:hypothetical protein
MFEIHVRAVHEVESAGPRHDLVQNVYVVHSALSNADKHGDIATQVQQGAYPDGALCLRTFVRGNNARHKSMVVESNA